jgi:hypothetical protein
MVPQVGERHQDRVDNVTTESSLIGFRIKGEFELAGLYADKAYRTANSVLPPYCGAEFGRALPHFWIFHL